MIGNELRKRNTTIALHVLYAKKEKYILLMFQNIKHNSNSEKQVILLLISNGEGWHYLGAKNY